MPGGFGGMIACGVKGGYDAAYRVIGRTKLCILAISLGGVETQQTDERMLKPASHPG
ncbi:hypothetical protein [Candidatus Roseilinea sp. NK_OTU-006]|jgi:cystathionine beta-lyase/cystathionine gamma-synthase|uniref:hypothetical protein n=1 Tax=Candidatus Roseilinea sp. NK_OTU-006 TaxID=2704250 RepID=UPI001F0A42A8|nr:hypothetical protein [Candidatus Roseilinea sp. NK_OTU-006]